MTAQRWAWGLGLVIALAVFTSYDPKSGSLIAGMVLVGVLLYQKQNNTGIFST